MNHKDGCPRQKYQYSGEGYNRVKVCKETGCQAEDHAPEIREATDEDVKKMTSVLRRAREQGNPCFFCGGTFGEHASTCDQRFM